MHVKAPTAALVTSLLCLSSLPAFAVPITYIYAGHGGGSLGEAIFSDRAFTITALADTDNIAPWSSAGGGPQNTHISTTIDIGGLGLLTINTPSHTWLAAGCCGGLGQNLSLNWITIDAPALVSVGYDLSTNIGPIVDNTPSHFNQFANVSTSGGLLSFRDISDVTFSAITGTVAVPEPTTISLLCLGLIGFAVRRRTRSSSAL